MNCPGCDSVLPSHVDRCPGCFRDAGAPNVRAAREPAEREALAGRLAEALAHAAEDGSAEVLGRFREAVRGSRAVLCRPLAQVQELASSDNVLDATFYNLIGAGVRLPLDNRFDRSRESADSNLFPFYKDHVRFASLTLDGKGLDSYGGFSVVLRADGIESRATVFEENSHLFFDRHKIAATEGAPAGHRATWDERDPLAAAKLHPRLRADAEDRDFPGILQQSTGDTAADDFIEVNIYGPLNRRSIERILGKAPKRKADQIIVADLRRKLKSDGLSIPIELHA